MILVFLCISFLSWALAFRESIVFLRLLQSLARFHVSCLMISVQFILLNQKLSCILAFHRLLELKLFGYLMIFIMATF